MLIDMGDMLEWNKNFNNNAFCGKKKYYFSIKKHIFTCNDNISCTLKCFCCYCLLKGKDISYQLQERLYIFVIEHRLILIFFILPSYLIQRITGVRLLPLSYTFIFFYWTLRNCFYGFVKNIFILSCNHLIRACEIWNKLRTFHGLIKVSMWFSLYIKMWIKSIRYYCEVLYLFRRIN